MSSLIATCIEDGVGIITFNQPEKHNALDDELFEQFDAGLTWAQEAQAVWCVLLLGEGKSFSSGRDTRTLNWPTDASPYTLRRVPSMPPCALSCAPRRRCPRRMTTTRPSKRWQPSVGPTTPGGDHEHEAN